MGTAPARGAAGGEGAAVAPGRGAVSTLIPSQSLNLNTLLGHPEVTMVESEGQVIQVLFGQQMILLAQRVVSNMELLGATEWLSPLSV